MKELNNALGNFGADFLNFVELFRRRLLEFVHGAEMFRQQLSRALAHKTNSYGVNYPGQFSLLALLDLFQQILRGLLPHTLEVASCSSSRR